MGVYRRNRKHLLKVEEPPPEIEYIEDEMQNGTQSEPEKKDEVQEDSNNPSQSYYTRSGRLVKQPDGLRY